VREYSTGERECSTGERECPTGERECSTGERECSTGERECSTGEKVLYRLNIVCFACWFRKMNYQQDSSRIFHRSCTDCWVSWGSASALV